jgi:hypothetical protein
MTKGRQGANTVEFTERGAARLEKRLRRDHQNAHFPADFGTNP